MNDLHRSMILDKLARMKARHPVVLRFAEMFPSALARYEMHAVGGRSWSRRSRPPLRATSPKSSRR
jgi:hypothetical protein